jgi:hypothetical protein
VRENSVIRRFSNQSRRTRNDAPGAEQSGEVPKGFYQQKLKEALGAGVEALNDPDIKARVEAYFCENSTYSRDAVHVAAVACRFKKKKVFAGKQQRRETSFLPRPG